MFTWPLNTNSFNLLDKLKISKFILTDDRWTQGKYVKQYEDLWSDYVGSKAVMVSSGSTANELIALRTKHELEQLNKWPKKNKVLFPANTWISSVSPWVNFGFEPVFIDINSDFGMCHREFLAYIKKYGVTNVAGVFYTTLLGFCPDSLIDIQEECKKRGIFFKLDNCESSFSKISLDEYEDRNINSLATSSTSFYLSHLTTSGSEGGMIFCDNEEEHQWYLLARSHGMTKSLNSYYDGFVVDGYRNFDVDERFDFSMMGSNYRSSDYAAFPAILDFQNKDRYINHRVEMYALFEDNLRDDIRTPDPSIGVPFALPIVCESLDLLNNIKFYCNRNGIEYRPVVGGNLLRHTAFKKYGNPEDYPEADFIHKNGIYIGLNQSVTAKMIKKFCRDIDKL